MSSASEGPSCMGAGNGIRIYAESLNQSPFSKARCFTRSAVVGVRRTCCNGTCKTITRDQLHSDKDQAAISEVQNVSARLRISHQKLYTGITYIFRLSMGSVDIVYRELHMPSPE